MAAVGTRPPYSSPNHRLVIIPAEVKVALAKAVEAASSAAERAEAIRRYVQEWIVSEATARRHAGIRIRPRPAREHGYPVPIEALEQAVGLWLSSATEKYTTATMPLADVIDMCEVAGIWEPSVLSLAQLRRYIRERRVTLADQRRGAPSIQMASPHPNYAHLADVTVCRQWFLKDDGRVEIQSYKRGTAEYRNRDLRGGVRLLR